MQFCTVREVKNPQRANSTDAGIDFFVPTDLTIKDCEKLIVDKTAFLYDIEYNLEQLNILPGGRVLIPSGVHVRLNPGTALVLMNKSGIAAKKGLIVGSCVVDESYQGEIHLSMINTTDHLVNIAPGDKIVQGLILNVNNDMPMEASDLEELYEGFDSERGAGGFGSSGTK